MQRTIAKIKDSLKEVYFDTEIESFIFLIFNHLWGFSKIDLILNKDKNLTNQEVEFVEDCISRLKQHEPIQYILGETEFYGYTFKCRKGALIPRGETEELVQLILQENTNENAKIVDIGTGTGCIPISLKKEQAKCEIHAVDISSEALELAKENSIFNNCKINFHQFDALSENWSIPHHYFDIMVSNPPYVRNLEKEQMELNVLEYEPHLALFVEDDDPLIFYRSIAENGLQHLNTNGKIYFEINEALGKETKQLLESLGYNHVEIIQDIHGKDRIVKATFTLSEND